jgi:uncharacterized protein (TIGR03000 family)
MSLKLMSLSAFAAAALFCIPARSEAQFSIRIGSGYGGPYYGGGYGYGVGRYGSGFGGPYWGGFGNGLSIGIGNRWNGSYSNGYYNNGNYNNGFYNAAPGAIYTQPSVVVGPTYQSNYPPANNGFIPANSQNGTASIVVTVPANAELWWNGLRISQTGVTRRFRTSQLGADGSVQTFQSRWTGADGQSVTQTREVRVTANGVSSVDFTQPPANDVNPETK